MWQQNLPVKDCPACILLKYYFIYRLAIVERFDNNLQALLVRF